MSEASDMMKLMMKVKYMDPRDKMTMENVLTEIEQLQKYRETVVDYCEERIVHIKSTRRAALTPLPGEDTAVWDRYEANYALGGIHAYQDIIRYSGE